MGDLLVREVADEALAEIERRARAEGRTLEQDVRELIERHGSARREAHAPQARPSPEERRALIRSFLDQYDAPRPSMTLDEIRDGLE